MTALPATTVLVLLLVAGATGGSWFLHRLAPGLSRRPRLGMALWASASALWALGALALSPLLAWTVNGPGLPGSVGAVCRRCLAAASPFGPTSWSTGVPTYAVLAVPVALALALLVTAALGRVSTRRALGTRIRALRAVAERRVLHGTTVWVVPDEAALAYTMPGRSPVARQDRIVLSRGTIAQLDDDQLAAVLAHERAHLRGRHHLLLATLRTLTGVLGWVPLVRHAGPAVAGYAEMAADDAARRTSGTRALAGALLALRDAPAPQMSLGVALHAGRHEPLTRVRRLAAPATPPSGVSLAAAALFLVLLAAPVVLVTTPYVALALNGTC